MINLIGLVVLLVFLVHGTVTLILRAWRGVDPGWGPVWIALEFCLTLYAVGP